MITSDAPLDVDQCHVAAHMLICHIEGREDTVLELHSVTSNVFGLDFRPRLPVTSTHVHEIRVVAEKS